MKKLMIAAAAAAMVGGAYAWTATYQFAANLQTTTGAKGYVTYTAGEAHLGARTVEDARGVMWYNDGNPAFGYASLCGLEALVVNQGTVNCNWTTAAAALYPNLEWYTAYSLTGAQYPGLRIKDSAGGIITWPEAALLTLLQNSYTRQMGGAWCGDFYWNIANNGRCYRVQSADTIVATVTLDNNCCTVGNLGFKIGANWAITWGETFGEAANLKNCFVNRFGEQTYAASSLREIFAFVRNLQTDTQGLDFVGYLAGQGSGQDMVATDDATVTANIPLQFTGMIVGVTDSPVCPDCCVLPLDQTVAFRCYDVIPQIGATNYDTAAYGTFYISYVNLVR